MTTNDTRQIEHYLYGEMQTDEREQFEERLFTIDDFFYKVAERENALVDRYAAKELTGEELARFEKSLVSIPSRKQKVSNAAALLNLIKDERPVIKTVTIAERSGFWAFFNLPSLSYGMAGLFVLMTITAVALLLENRQSRAEIARLQAEQQNSNIKSGREMELERELAISQNRETDLQANMDSERNVSGDLTADLERERENRRKLESEIETLRKQQPSIPRRDGPQSPEPPTIAAITLKPIGPRGGESPRINFEGGANRVSVLLTLPANTGSDERLAVQLNGRTIAENLKVRVESSGAKTLAITVPKGDLAIGRNKLAVTAGAKQIGEYDLSAEQD